LLEYLRKEEDLYFVFVVLEILNKSNPLIFYLAIEQLNTYGEIKGQLEKVINNIFNKQNIDILCPSTIASIRGTHNFGG
jgi:hypothetical protein